MAGSYVPAIKNPTSARQFESLMERSHAEGVWTPSTACGAVTDWVQFAMIASPYSPTWHKVHLTRREASPPSREASSDATRNDKLFAIILVVVMFGAPICGLWGGMTLSAALSPPDKGVMDTPY
jgi:hypothetical protein